MLPPASLMDEKELISILSMTPAGRNIEYIKSCKYSQVLLLMGENITRNM